MTQRKGFNVEVASKLTQEARQGMKIGDTDKLGLAALQSAGRFQTLRDIAWCFGYLVEKETGKWFTQKGKVKTYV